MPARAEDVVGLFHRLGHLAVVRAVNNIDHHIDIDGVVAQNAGCENRNNGNAKIQMCLK